MDRPAPSTRSGATPHGDWSYVAREPPVALRPYVRGFMGYRERSRVVVRRHELPSGTAPLIIGVDAGIDVLGADDDPSSPPLRTLVAVTPIHILNEEEEKAVNGPVDGFATTPTASR